MYHNHAVAPRQRPAGPPAPGGRTRNATSRSMLKNLKNSGLGGCTNSLGPDNTPSYNGGLSDLLRGLHLQLDEIAEQYDATQVCCAAARWRCPALDASHVSVTFTSGAIKAICVLVSLADKGHRHCHGWTECGSEHPRQPAWASSSS